MWKKLSHEYPLQTGFLQCFGILNKGSEFECKGRFYAFYDGETFTDRNGEDLTGINESVDYWFDFNEVENPF